MFPVVGKYATAKVFSDFVEQSAIAQVLELCNQPFVQGSTIRLMPDIHTGMGCTIGTTMTITDKIVPNLVGVDIGCGMETLKLNDKNLDFAAIDDCIRKAIPSGCSVRAKQHRQADSIPLEDLYCLKEIDYLRAKKSIGTLGGGNHFIEVDVDSNGNYYLVIHSGSRHLGVEVAKYYQKIAYDTLNQTTQEDIALLIAKMKEQGKEKQIQSELRKYCNTKRTRIPKDLCYVEGVFFDQYLHDMEIVQEFAVFNRKIMAQELIEALHLDVIETFTTIHNYIDIEYKILRKGAVSAKQGERLLIPMNMRDGSLICKGKGNPDWNYSAPHGAGRLMSRNQAKEMFSVEQYQAEMQGIYSTSIGWNTLDECPMAYKPMEEIVTHIEPTVEILEQIRPVYNFKAGDM